MGRLSLTMSEEDFHASAAAVRNGFRQQLRLLAGNCGGDESSRMAPSLLMTRHNFYIHPAHVNYCLSWEVPSGQYQQQQEQQVQHPPPSPLLSSSSDNNSPNPNDDLVNYQHTATHEIYHTSSTLIVLCPMIVNNNRCIVLGGTVIVLSSGKRPICLWHLCLWNQHL